ncbi:hypothetical protein EGW08_001636 [Elysia chlorotica]|uniref:Uncharacterized protein n=1 Tax=Elysia chlorotica TaxID=188477 RepID=A0A3S1A0F6_ELYCH|nr:hypothetical protein EGW08_001636 [Elysia chlorotica]
MPSFAFFGLLICAALGTLNGHSVGRPETNSPCEEAGGYVTTQLACTGLNDALTQAEYRREKDNVCKYYVEVLWCVARNVKECFDVFSNKMAVYSHSPYSCQVPTEELLQMQAVVYDEESETTETTPDSAPQPWTNGEGGGAKQEEGGAKQEGGVDSEKGYDIKPDPDGDKPSSNAVGSQEKHKGTDSDKDAGCHMTSWSLLVLLVLSVTSTQLPWKLLS